MLLAQRQEKFCSTGNNKPQFKWVAQNLYRHTGNNKYFALIKKRGKQTRKSLGTSDRQLADRKLLIFRGQISRSLNPTKDRDTTFMELAKDWFDLHKSRYKPNSARSAELCIKQLNKHFGTLPVRGISTRDCQNWEKTRAEKVSASSFNHDRTLLVAVLKFAVQEGLLTENPALLIPRRKLTKKGIKVPSRDEFRLLVNTIRAADPRAQHGANLVELLAYSGMRLSEATALTWGDIDFGRGVFTITGGAKGTKNHEARTIPIFPNLRSLLERLKKEQNPQADQRVIPIITARKAIDGACKKASLPHFHHHLFRHFFATEALELGIDPKTVADWLGHKDGGVLVLKTYGHLRKDHSTEMAQKMNFSASLSPAKPQSQDNPEAQACVR